MKELNPPSKWNSVTAPLYTEELTKMTNSKVYVHNKEFVIAQLIEVCDIHLLHIKDKDQPGLGN